MLIVMQEFLVRLISYSLIFKCWGSTTVVLFVLSSFILQDWYYGLEHFTTAWKKKQTESQKLLKINSKFWEVTTGREGLFGPPPSWTGYLYEGYAKKKFILSFRIICGSFTKSLLFSETRCIKIFMIV